MARVPSQSRCIPQLCTDRPDRPVAHDLTRRPSAPPSTPQHRQIRQPAGSRGLALHLDLAGLVGIPSSFLPLSISCLSPLRLTVSDSTGCRSQPPRVRFPFAFASAVAFYTCFGRFFKHTSRRRLELDRRNCTCLIDQDSTRLDIPDPRVPPFQVLFCTLPWQSSLSNSPLCACQTRSLRFLRPPAAARPIPSIPSIPPLGLGLGVGWLCLSLCLCLAAALALDGTPHLLRLFAEHGTKTIRFSGCSQVPG